MSHMKTPFDTTTINGMQLKNRFVRSATWEGMCDEKGVPTKKLNEYYRELAQGKVGLIITGYTYVRSEGKQMPGKMGLCSDDSEKEMRDLVRAVHQQGGKICIQLVHAGGQAYKESAGCQPVAPSSIEADQYPQLARELSTEEIGEIVEAFAQASCRAKRYGFDAIQLHGAHGYLISQFLSPLTNKREDRYGGSIENRCRFLMEVYSRIRETVGKDYPILIKINGSDNMAGGMSTDDALYASKILDQAGIDAIEVSAGTPASGRLKPARINIKAPDMEAYNLDMARQVKEEVNCKVMVVGGFRSWEVIQRAVEKDEMDYISMSRPFIMEPGIVRRWQDGDYSPSRCTSCNGCFKPGLQEGGIRCVVK